MLPHSVYYKYYSTAALKGLKNNLNIFKKYILLFEYLDKQIKSVELSFFFAIACFSFVG